MSTKSLKMKMNETIINNRVSFLKDSLLRIKEILTLLNKINALVQDRVISKDVNYKLQVITLQSDLYHILVNMKYTVKKTEEKIVFSFMKYTNDLIDVKNNNTISVNALKAIKNKTDNVLKSVNNYVNLQPHDNYYE